LLRRFRCPGSRFASARRGLGRGRAQACRDRARILEKETRQKTRIERDQTA
jgi:hypothetical protein